MGAQSVYGYRFEARGSMVALCLGRKVCAMAGVTETRTVAAEQYRVAELIAPRPHHPFVCAVCGQPAQSHRQEEAPMSTQDDGRPAAEAGSANLAAALARFQAQLPAVGKSRTANVTTRDGGYSYAYADLADLVAAVLPRLAACGLAFTAHIRLTDAGRLVLVSELRHQGGERLCSEWPLPDTTDSQRIGSAITYARRYCLLAMCGVHPQGEDDDGRAAATAPGSTSVPSPTWNDAIRAAHAAGADRDEFLADLADRFGPRAPTGLDGSFEHLTPADLGTVIEHWRQVERDRADTAEQARRQETMADATGR